MCLCATDRVWRDLYVYGTMVCYVDQIAAYSATPALSLPSSSFLHCCCCCFHVQSIARTVHCIWCWYHCLFRWWKWFGGLQVDLRWWSISWPEFGMVADIIHLCIDILESSYQVVLLLCSVKMREVLLTWIPLGDHWASLMNHWVLSKNRHLVSQVPSMAIVLHVCK